MNARIDPHQAAGFAEAMRREAGVAPSISPATAPRLTPTFPKLREGDIELGVADTGGPIGADLGKLIEGRLLVQGTSGAGKSWTLRRLLEQSHGRVQQIVVDPEGEFGSLAEAKGYLRLDAARLDIAALAALAAGARTHRVSVHLDLSDCEREAQMIAVAAFLRALIDAPRDDWHAVLVAIDEAHLFAPFGGDAAAPASVRKAAIGALIDLAGGIGKRRRPTHRRDPPRKHAERARLHPRSGLLLGGTGARCLASARARRRAADADGGAARRGSASGRRCLRAARSLRRSRLLRGRRGAGSAHQSRLPGAALMSLEPVDFSRRQAPQPRLTPKRVPGRHAETYWRPEEEAILVATYPIHGAAACLEKLPRRSRTTIYQRARQLGLSAPGQSGLPRRRRSTADVAALDEKIRKVWPTLTCRGAVQRFADEIGEDRRMISQRAGALGLTKAHRRKEPGWTAAEDALMGRIRLNDPDHAARVFKEHGFNRSPTAITVRAKRLGLSRQRRDVLSATKAAAILGVDSKWVTARCIDGTLEAEKRGTSRLVQQGGDTWSIRPDALRAYIVANLEEIDIRKVEKFAFVALLVEPSAEAPLP